jgi:hypothetical protein
MLSVYLWDARDGAGGQKWLIWDRAADCVLSSGAAPTDISRQCEVESIVDARQRGIEV